MKVLEDILSWCVKNKNALIWGIIGLICLIALTSQG